MAAVWCVYKVKRDFPHQYVPKLIIADVPPEVEITEGLLQEAGYCFEKSVPWVNHGVEVFEKLFPADWLERVRYEIESISFEELQALLRGCLFAVANRMLNHTIYRTIEYEEEE